MKKLLEKISKKLNNIMAGFDVDEFMSIKDGYMGQTYQWVKTTDAARLGKVVKVNDVLVGPRIRVDDQMVQKYIVLLSDGARIDSEALNNNLMMLMEDQQPMNMAELISINQVAPIVAEEIVAALPPDLRATSSLMNTVNQVQPAANDTGQSQFQLTRDPHQGQSRQAPPPPKTEDLFGLFALEDTDILLSLSIKLPAKDFLKMMYLNSQDKDKFLNQLSAYINNSITPDSIKDSVEKMMGPDKKKKAI